MKGIELNWLIAVYFRLIFVKNPREYASIHSGFSSIRQKSTRYQLLRTENEIIFMDFSVQRGLWGPQKVIFLGRGGIATRVRERSHLNALNEYGA